MSNTGSTRRLYRIVKGDPPTPTAFTTLSGPGRALRPVASAGARRLWHGLSMMDTLERVRALRRRIPMLGASIAALDIPWRDRIRIERTLREPGHHTVWGDPDELV